jgi:alkylhydroperoxidase family enzyme
MSRIAPVEPENASPEVRAVYDKIEADGLALFNVIKLFGNNQHFVAALHNMIRGLYVEGKLEPRYRELAYLRASQLNSCHY